MLNQKALDTKLLTAETITLTTSSLSHLASASVTLTLVGKVGILAITAKNNSSALATGSDASFTITDLPILKVSSRGSGYSGATCIVANVEKSTSVVSMRVTAYQWLPNYDIYLTIPVILE